MNESEKRRQILLNQTRDLYGERRSIPAVHPRHQSFYSKLYGGDRQEDEILVSTLSLRIFICLILFVSFVLADYRGSTVANVGSERIVQEIEFQFDVSGLWNNW